MQHRLPPTGMPESSIGGVVSGVYIDTVEMLRCSREASWPDSDRRPWRLTFHRGEIPHSGLRCAHSLPQVLVSLRVIEPLTNSSSKRNSAVTDRSARSASQVALEGIRMNGLVQFVRSTSAVQL